MGFSCLCLMGPDPWDPGGFDGGGEASQGKPFSGQYPFLLAPTSWACPSWLTALPSLGSVWGTGGCWNYFKSSFQPALPQSFATGHLPLPVGPGMLIGSWPGWGLGTDCYKAGDTVGGSCPSPEPATVPSTTTMSTHRLVMVRHGESTWNQENRFCGWFDAELSEKGAEEAKRGAQAVKDAKMEFDICYTSVLKRAIRTLWTILDGTDQMWLPVVRTWRLNERHYGGLTGLNKAETAAKHGEEQVKVWRRSFDIPPPPMDEKHPYYSSISKVGGWGGGRRAGGRPGAGPRDRAGWGGCLWVHSSMVPPGAALCRPEARGTAYLREPQGHHRPGPALLERGDRPPDKGWQEGADCSPREQPAGHCQAPGR